MIDIEFNRVSKQYRLRTSHPSWRLWYADRFTRRTPPMWALRDVSFQVRQGEALGIVGHNGAGKSTILKLLSSITAPTAGEIRVRGRMAALVEVGSGFHPELSGRENIDLHGAMLGMRRSEIRQKLDSIIEFSGVGQYIDVPVKRYSSGMYVRLGFSIAAHLNPDILLLDEVLAVGDAAFQAKCLDRISELRRNGRTVIFISHDLAAVYRLCDRALLLNHGRVVAEGPPRKVIDQYQQMTFGDDTSAVTAVASESPAECTGVAFLAPDSSAGIRTGHPMVARLGYRTRQAIPAAVFRISLFWPSGYLCAQLTTDSTAGGFHLGPGEGRIEFRCPVMPMVPGLYRVDLSIESNGQEIELRQRCATLNVGMGKFAAGDFYIENSWKLVEGTWQEENSLG
ncbi:MAG TPA: ABC transporter ATP-binding protein [Terriglobales bacterium]|nr:ABC transporter ATP-binding protein [Terriglobales bacterium]